MEIPEKEADVGVEAEADGSKPRPSGAPVKRDLVALRNDELCGLLVGYAFALQ